MKIALPPGSAPVCSTVTFTGGGLFALYVAAVAAVASAAARPRPLMVKVPHTLSSPSMRYLQTRIIDCARSNRSEIVIAIVPSGEGGGRIVMEIWLVLSIQPGLHGIDVALVDLAIREKPRLYLRSGMVFGGC